MFTTLLCSICAPCDTKLLAYQFKLRLLQRSRIPVIAFSTGSPKYFSPILHYLRTNNLEIPSGVNRQSLQLEAEYYGIQKIVEHLKHLETEKKESESIQKSERNKNNILIHNNYARAYVRKTLRRKR